LTALGVLGMSGMTAYVALLEIGQPKPGKTVVVAAASGAVGSMVCQIAKVRDCRAIGIAGGAEKRQYVTGAASDFRFEGASATSSRLTMADGVSAMPPTPGIVLHRGKWSDGPVH
jgi:NADPH-dependent curcumin reductase CurA